MTQDVLEQASIQLAKQIKDYLQDKQLGADLPNISYEILALQLIDSVEHENQIKAIADTKIPSTCCNPDSDSFDPIKAIVLLKDSDYDEAAL